MQKANILFKEAQIDRLFPFFILINKDFTIHSCGSSFIKLYGSCCGNLFSASFSVKSPKLKVTTFLQLQSISGQIVVFKIGNEHKKELEGQLEFLEATNQLLFLGLPKQTTGSNLLALLKVKEADNDTLKLEIAAIRATKAQLRKATQEAQDIALFPIENPDPVFRIQNNGSIILRNPAAEKLISFSYNGNHYKANSFFKLIIKINKQVTHRWVFEASSNGILYSFICVHLTDKKYYNVYGRNITQEKEKEEALLRLSLVASTNESGVLFMSESGAVSWVNDGFCKMTGFGADEALGKTPIELCEGTLTDKAALKRMVEAFEKAQSFNEELVHYRKNGTWFWGRVKGQVYKNGEENGYKYFAMVDDITAEKQKEERLTILSQIAESNINAVITTDKSGKINWINESFTKITGYSQKEIIGKKLVQLLNGPEINIQTSDYIKKQISKGQPFSAEIYNFSKSGAAYWLRVNGQPIYNEAGVLTGFFAIEQDITKEKQTQNTAKLSELKFWIALEKIYENAWEHDFVKGKTFFSKSNNDFWGYTNNEQPNSENIWWDSIYKDDLHLIEDTYAKYLAKEIDSHNLEYRIFHKNGTMKWVMDRGVVLERDKDGKPLRTIGTHTDITQNKLTETELEQRVKQFKSLSENIPGVIYEYEFRQDGTEGFRYISPAIERLFGIKPNDFHNYLNYIHPDDRNRILQKNECSKKNLDSFYDESLLIVPGAGLKWHAVYLSFSYIAQNGAKVFTGFMMDITERKNAEDILRANEEKYRSIIANMKLGLIEMDNHTNIVYTNNSFCDMSGYSVAELIGKNASSLFTNDKNAALLAQKTEMRENGVADAYQVEMIDKKGNLNWWLVSGAPRYNDNGQKLGSIGIYLDISEQKKLENALIMAREQAEQSAKTKEIFLANMSHEMRTPMNAIIGMSNQLGKTKLDSKQKFYLDTVHSAADNLLIIINDILDLSKIEAGKLSLENIGFEPRVLLEKNIQILAYKAEEKGLELTNTFFDEKIANILIGDNYRLNQVLLNLVSNAIKFTEKGSIGISFTLEKNTRASQLIAIEVSDTGIGMDESFIDHLFDKFSQEYESVSRKFGGTGLGMSICKELIVLMGGDITAKSTKGKGTTISFKIEFKKGTKAQLPKEETIQISNNILLGKKILVADDNDLNRLVASMILKDYGAEIIEANNGQQAIDKFKQQKCDIILMDIQMPELNGYDTTTLLRKTDSTIPIIALTANAIKGESEKCIAVGMNDYIAKPFKEKELLIKIAKWLGTKVVIVKKPKKVKAAPLPRLYNLYKLRGMSAANEPFVKEMVQMFCEQTPEMVEAMANAYTQNNFEKMGFFAHKMRSSIDSLDIQILKKGIKEIEAIGLGKQQDSSNLPKLINEVNTVITKVVGILTKKYPPIITKQIM